MHRHDYGVLSLLARAHHQVRWTVGLPRGQAALHVAKHAVCARYRHSGMKANVLLGRRSGAKITHFAVRIG
jgi:hypothetical protein